MLVSYAVRMEHCERVQVITAAKHICIANCRECVFFLGVNQRPLIVGDNHKLQAVRMEHCERVQVITAAKHICIANCRECVFFLGVNQRPLIVGDNHKLQAVRMEHCERVQVITAAKHICIANCRECVFFLGVNQRPLIVGDNHKLQVAPFNTYYSQLEEHIAQVGVDLTVNKWDEPLVLGMVDPHDSISHPAGVSDVQAESATCLDPDQFTIFLIPKCLGAESPQPTKYIPFRLPEIYSESQKRKHSVLSDIQQALRDVQLDANRKRDLAMALHVHFKDWLYGEVGILEFRMHSATVNTTFPVNTIVHYSAICIGQLGSALGILLSNLIP
ncbi:putative TBCC domain-containing protein 1 [Cocos nucifera]|uniref:TBCC domain-containing protein 1 n=1 Tax=Cocos nucifera TaxID=13894 RepID=A0A8K0HV76_COCNU|nr:putative TBCC domain-containing protein 1 [Cocos nucifera]